jgi:electron transfer flavoprotein alpha subunit
MPHLVLTIVEHRDGAIRKSSLEALALGSRLAAAAGGTQAAVIAGKGIANLAPEIAARGAALVCVADHDVVAQYSTEGYAAAAARAAEKSGASVILGSATAMGKDLAPRIAARLGYTYLSDAVEAGVENGRLVVVRPEYAGKALLRLGMPFGKAVVTVRPNVFPAGTPASGGTPETASIDLSDVRPRARVVRFVGTSQETVDVSEAEIIVSGGRGLKGPENFPLVFELAKALGAGVGASRAVVDAGWIDHDHQVGQTGKTVSPTLYVACGISGAIQHLAGMRTSKCIVAINKDADAPIFKIADYGLPGDLFEILPRLTEAVKKVKGAG